MLRSLSYLFVYYISLNDCTLGLQKAINFSIPYQRKLWIQSEKESLDAVIKAGVQVSYPEKKKFKEATYSMYNSFRKNFEMNQLIDRIQNEKN